MKMHSLALSVMCAVLCLLPSFALSQAGKIGYVTAAPTNTVISAPSTTNATTNTVLATPQASAGVIAGNGTLQYSPSSTINPVGISAPGANAQFTPTAVSGQGGGGGSLSYAPVSMSEGHSSSASVVLSSNFAPAFNLPASSLLADELCLPVNTPKTPKEKPRTLVESGLIGGVYYSQAVVKDAAGKMVPGLVQEVIEIPDKPEYEVSTGYVYKRLPSEKGYSVPGIAAVTILFGIRWGVQTVSVASSAGGSLGGAISSSSHGGGLNSASMSGVTDVIRLAHWKGTRCVANKEWVEQMVSLSVGEANADCRTLVQGDEGLTVAKFTGTPECQLRWGVEIKAERKSIMGNLAKVAKPPQAVKPQVAVSAAKAPQ